MFFFLNLGPALKKQNHTPKNPGVFGVFLLIPRGMGASHPEHLVVGVTQFDTFHRNEAQRWSCLRFGAHSFHGRKEVGNWGCNPYF